MGGGDKGGSADQSGMFEAQAAAQAADKAYQLGEQQLQWTQQVWNQEQPLMDASEKQQMALASEQEANLQQMTAEAQAQWGTYEGTYLPLEEKFAGQAQNWASPAALAGARGEAMSGVAEQGQAGLNTAAETLRGYGINPSSPRYASLYTSAQPMLGAAEAAAGTTSAQNLRMQQMELEGAAINTGRGMVNTTGSLTSAGTGAGAAGSGSASGAANTANTNLSTGSTAMTNPTAWFNAGANNMNSYVNAVNGYNQSQASFNEAGAQEMGGLGSALGSVLGLGFMGKFNTGGPAIRFDDGGAVGALSPALTTDLGPGGYWPTAAPAAPSSYRDPPPIPASAPALIAMHGQPAGALGMPNGQVQQIRIHPDVPRQPPPRGQPPIYSRAEGRQAPLMRAYGGPIGYQGGAEVMGDDMQGSDPQLTPTQGGGDSGIPPQPMPPAQAPAGLPSDATPGGGVPAYASPSGGQQTDDVPAQLTAGEFVIPKDVAMWKGHEYFAKQLDAARAAQQKFASRDDVGGEPTGAIPQMPAFVSRPSNMGMTRGAIPAMA